MQKMHLFENCNNGETLWFRKSSTYGGRYFILTPVRMSHIPGDFEDSRHTRDTFTTLKECEKYAKVFFLHLDESPSIKYKKR